MVPHASPDEPSRASPTCQHEVIDHPLPRPHLVAVEQVAQTLRRHLDVAGTYLHGSAALGGFVPGRSDLDVLVVVGGGPSRDALDTVGHELLAIDTPSPGLELSIVSRHQAATATPEPGYLLHVASDDGRVVHGDGRIDPDLILHHAVCRQAGVPIGDSPPAAALIARQDGPTVRRQLAAELTWAIEHAPTHYLVLNTCRAHHHLRHGRFISKIDGGGWALAHGIGDRALIEAALHRQHGDADAPAPPTAPARAFAEATRAALLAG